MDQTVRHVVRRGLSLAQSRYLPDYISASKIRKSFLDFFCESHDHLHISSAPVFSMKDPTLAFINAGMNQFKNVFLGIIQPASDRVANSQKCIRIGGKHNDLSQVGYDGTHHTFFEMLGNWSFGDYFKREACQMSWDLLTKTFELSPERLYVTYFGGNKNLGLEPDVEVRDIWREIGVEESHILPFDAKENFWEGGLTGPCGPCTEIHYDHCPGRTNAANLVNSGNSTLTELWNLVFIQYNRLEDGSLIKLKRHFVDTGMGFERLVAVLQGKSSNYDTDLFQPLFKAIQNYSGQTKYGGKYDGNSIDCGYRILADHSRMLTVALSDGMIPSQQNKIRKVLRKALIVSEKIFKAEVGLLKELAYYVAESLSDAYPQIGNNLKKIHYILESEEEVMKSELNAAMASWKSLLKKYPTLESLDFMEFPQLAKGMHYVEKNVLMKKKTTITKEDTWKLFDTLGVPIAATEQLALALGLQYNADAFEKYKLSLISDERERQDVLLQKNLKKILPFNILSSFEEKNLESTIDYFKYDYRLDGSGNYIFKKQPATIKAIIHNGKLLDEISLVDIQGLIIRNEQEVGLLLDRTHLFSKEGNQESDTGTFIIENSIIFDVKRVEKIKNWVVHFGNFRELSSDSKVHVNYIGVLELDKERRLNIMRNHTALHLLSTAIREIIFVAGEKFSLVTPENLFFKFMIYKKKLELNDIIIIENFVKKIILHDVSVKRRIFTHSTFQNLNNVVFIPGEPILSFEIPVIEINSGYDLSREYCTGTHVLNTADLKDFVIMEFKGHYGVKSITALTGEAALRVRKADDDMKEKLSSLKNKIMESTQSVSQIDEVSSELDKFNSEIADANLSYIVKAKLLKFIEEARLSCKKNKAKAVRLFIENEIENSLATADCNFAVQCIDITPQMDVKDISDILDNQKSQPVMIFLKSENSVQIHCVVPQDFVSKDFSAEIWLKESLSAVGGIGYCRKGHNPNFRYSMKDREVTEEQLAKCMKLARSFAINNLTALVKKF